MTTKRKKAHKDDNPFMPLVHFAADASALPCVKHIYEYIALPLYILFENGSYHTVIIIDLNLWNGLVKVIRGLKIIISVTEQK